MTGDKAVDSLLKKLPAKVGKKVLKKALRESLKPVLKDARKNAPKDSGALRKDTKIRAEKGKPGRVAFNVYSAVTSEEGERYAFIQEFGSEARGIPATRWLARTYDAHKGTVFKDIRVRLTRGIAEAIKSLKK